MKNILFILLFFSTYFFFSCDGDHSHDSGNQDEMEDVVSVKDTISEAKFNKWKNAWDKEGEAYMDTASLFQYFTMPIVDLKEVLAENAKGTKFYFGLDKTKDGGNMLKFMLIGTDEKGADLIDYKGNNYVYDFSRLCPPFCEN